MVTISQELCNECAALLYRKWSSAYDTLKAVKAEVNDGSTDWHLFHAERLKNATTAEATAKHFLNEISPLHTIGKP